MNKYLQVWRKKKTMISVILAAGEDADRIIEMSTDPEKERIKMDALLAELDDARRIIQEEIEEGRNKLRERRRLIHYMKQ